MLPAKGEHAQAVDIGGPRGRQTGTNDPIQGLCAKMHVPEESRMASERSKKAKLPLDKKEKGDPQPAQQRQNEREAQTGRGSGEGKSGLQRGDGHPTGR